LTPRDTYVDLFIFLSECMNKAAYTDGCSYTNGTRWDILGAAPWTEVTAEPSSSELRPTYRHLPRWAVDTGQYLKCASAGLLFKPGAVPWCGFAGTRGRGGLVSTMGITRGCLRWQMKGYVLQQNKPPTRSASRLKSLGHGLTKEAQQIGQAKRCDTMLACWRGQLCML
jgi:hypothetical protein